MWCWCWPKYEKQEDITPLLRVEEVQVRRVYIDSLQVAGLDMMTEWRSLKQSVIDLDSLVRRRDEVIHINDDYVM